MGERTPDGDMDRVPEPKEVMDEIDQAMAYAIADFADVNQKFVDRFVELFGDFSGGRVLDLGCGPADIPIRLCREFPDIHITAVDASPAMIDIARRDIAVASLADRIVLVTATLPCPTFSDAVYDAVISNSLLHHLENPSTLWSTIRATARSDAPILVVDLFRPESRDAAARIVETASANEPEVLRRDFFHSLLAAYSRDEIRDQLRAANLSCLSCEIVSDRHVAVWGRR